MQVLMSYVSRCCRVGEVHSHMPTRHLQQNLQALSHMLLHRLFPRGMQVLRLIVDTGEVDNHRSHGKDELLSIIKDVDEDRCFIVVVIT